MYHFSLHNISSHPNTTEMHHTRCISHVHPSPPFLPREDKYIYLSPNDFARSRIIFQNPTPPRRVSAAFDDGFQIPMCDDSIEFSLLVLHI